MIIDFLRLLIAAICIATGILVMAVSTFGVFRIRYVLNRLHSAAMGDSMGIGLVILGLIILNGFTVVSLKLLMILGIFWLASPVCSHLLSSLEVFTNDRLDRVCESIELEPDPTKEVSQQS